MLVLSHRVNKHFTLTSYVPHYLTTIKPWSCMLMLKDLMSILWELTKIIFKHNNRIKTHVIVLDQSMLLLTLLVLEYVSEVSINFKPFIFQVVFVDVVCTLILIL